MYFFYCLTIYLQAQNETEKIIIIKLMVSAGRMFLKEWILLLPTTVSITRAIAVIYFLHIGVMMKTEKKTDAVLMESTVLNHGQLFGNRTAGSKVDNANPYWFSYPGYSEIMTGYADTAINSNSYDPNPM